MSKKLSPENRSTLSDNSVGCNKICFTPGFNVSVLSTSHHYHFLQSHFHIRPAHSLPLCHFHRKCHQVGLINCLNTDNYFFIMKRFLVPSCMLRHGEIIPDSRHSYLEQRALLKLIQDTRLISLTGYESTNISDSVARKRPRETRRKCNVQSLQI
jgi:hypothetical protein